MREGSGTQSIHIVDDDEAVRNSLAPWWRPQGFLSKIYPSAIELQPARAVWQLIALWLISACPRWMGLNSSRS